MSELWTHAAFFIPSVCTGGPLEFGQNPACGRVDILLDQSLDVSGSDDALSVGVEVMPFEGDVDATRLYFYSRRAEVALRALVNVVLDLSVNSITSGDYGTVEDLLIEAIPCAELSEALDSLVCDLSSGQVCGLSGVQDLCEAAATQAVNALDTALAEIPATLELEFSGEALLHFEDESNRVNVLGTLSEGVIPREAPISGTSDFLLTSGDLGDSWWYGER